VLLGIAFIASPEALNGAETVTPLLEIGIFVLPVGLTTVLWGASSPDPRLTTVRGVFGNPDEALLSRMLEGTPRSIDVRYLPNPREPVNCRHCYTLIPWNVAECPRCARRRDCRACGKSLYFVTGAVRCLPCVRDETFCNCPKVKRGVALGARGHP